MPLDKNVIDLEGPTLKIYLMNIHAIVLVTDKLTGILMRQVFEFTDYKAYLNSVLSTTGSQRGMRSKLATHLRCQISFLSQVLNGDTHLSLEHGLKISEFLGHSDEETHFFILLLEAGRAGSSSLRVYFKKQIDEVLAKRTEIDKRVKASDSLNLESQTRYYSTWYYAAIHIALSIPDFQTPAAICERLKLPMKLVVTTLEFLESVGLAKFNQGKYEIGPKRIHLNRKSDLISKHHSNWRLQSLHCLERRNDDDLNYSSVYSIAKSDLAKVRLILVQAIDQFEPLIISSKEEELICINLDLLVL